MFLPSIAAKLLTELFSSGSFHARFAYPFKQKGFVSFELVSGYPQNGLVIQDYEGGPNRSKIFYRLDIVDSDQSSVTIKLEEVRAGFTRSNPTEADLNKVISLILLIPEQKAEWWLQTGTPEEKEISLRDDPTICAIAKVILKELPDNLIPTDSQRLEWSEAIARNQLSY